MAMNLVTTIVNMRAPGMTMHRLPLFVWAMLAQSVIILLCIPVLAGTFKYASLISFAVLAILFSVNKQTFVSSRKRRSLKCLNDCNKEGTSNIGPWLAGLIEGDGTRFIPKSSANKTIYPQRHVHIHIHDLPLVEHLQHVLRSGSIALYPLTKSCRLTFASLPDQFSAAFFQAAGL